MEWKEFSESNKEYPEVLVAKAVSGFPKATKNLLQLTIQELPETAIRSIRFRTDFEFSLYLKSEYVQDYRFKVFSFGYDIELTPIHIQLEDSIFVELFQKKMEYKETISVESEEKFNNLLERIFNTNRFNEIVSGLMKIARKNKEMSSEF